MNLGTRSTQQDTSASLDASQGFRGKRWLDMARELLDGDPSDVDTATAIYYLRADMGDLPPDELAEMVRSLTEAEEGPTCICPPELLARGGFKGGCLVHG